LAALKAARDAAELERQQAQEERARALDERNRAVAAAAQVWQSRGRP
jgi:hypothetical protein